MPGVTMWLMNTGYIGGDAKDVQEDKALKVKIRHSSAMLEALLGDNIKWKTDPDFGYEIVDIDDSQNRELVQRVPEEILNPARFYEKTGRSGEYRAWVAQMKQGRREFLEQYKVADAIIGATCT